MAQNTENGSSVSGNGNGMVQNTENGMMHDRPAWMRDMWEML